MRSAIEERELGDKALRDPLDLKQSEDGQQLRRVIEVDVPRLTWEWH